MTRRNARYFAQEMYWLAHYHAIYESSYGSIVSNNDGWLASVGGWLVEMNSNGAIVRMTKEKLQ